MQDHVSILAGHQTMTTTNVSHGNVNQPENASVELLDSSPSLGAIVHGSLQTGLQMRLDRRQSIEDIRAGKFVVVHGQKSEFFAMITDVAIDVSSPAVLANPPSNDDRLGGVMQKVLSGQSIYGTITLRPLLMRDLSGSAEFQPVKTVPAHFSVVRDATGDDVASIFGREDGANGFYDIGSPLDMDDITVCLDLKRFAERSNGIFGKSGTGKTFLTRLCLAGLIKHRAAVNLIFDMHNEYGWEAGQEDPAAPVVQGLKQFFDSEVSIFSLDPASSARRRVRPDYEVKIPFQQITPDDILLLAGELNLNPTAAETTYVLYQRFGDNWLSELLAMDASAQKEFCDQSGAHPQAIGALHRKLSPMVENCKGFLHKNLQRADDAVSQIMGALTRGKHVVLEFGQYRKPVQYMLVANILTRKIHEEYTTRMEAAGFDKGRQPPPLVITIEEAHKFLSPGLASQTIFGTIAREMRKYNVTLLVVDQRPSGIDDEVLSQLGTRITCLLNDEKDIDAVLTGVPGAATLRGVLASLDSKQQALLLGHAVPMPVVIRTRTYGDDAFRASMGTLSRQLAEAAERLEDMEDWNH